MVKKLYSILILCLFVNLANAQITDVFQNKEYRTSTYVLTEEMDKDYAPSSVEILQDKNKDENESWIKIEKQLKTTAIGQIENEVAFFQLHTKALNYQKQIDDWNRLQDYSYSAPSYNPSFESIEITLMSVLNNIGVYVIQHNFDGGNSSEKITVKNYYLADYQENKITKVGDTPNLQQQELLKELTLAKFSVQYLLQTQKLDLDNVKRIRPTMEDKENYPVFSSNIDYSEALVYPFFSGIMVEFPTFSKSSKIFNNQPFRLFLKGTESVELLSVYPNFIKAFKNPLKTPSGVTTMQLNDDANFDLSRFNTAPKELRMLKVLNSSVAEKKISVLKINTYQKNDTVKTRTGSKKLFFNLEGQVYRIESRNEKDEITSEEKFNYNKNNQLTDIRTTAYKQSLKLNFYEKDILSYIENIELDHNRDDSYQELIELNISQQHLVYSNNYRYTLEFNLVGDFDRNRMVITRYVEKNQYCNYVVCLLTNNNGQVVGVKSKSSSPIDVLTNSKNQPIESYFDHDRYSHFFTYDDNDRIQKFSTYSNGKLADLVEYKYGQKDQIPLTITETKMAYSSSYVNVQEYLLEYW